MDQVGKRLLLLASIFCLLLTVPAFATTWDAAADFSLTTNPLGAWSYGYSDTVGGTTTLYNQFDSAILGGGGVAWDMSPDPNAWSGFVTKNTNATPKSWFGLTIPAGGIAFHPGFTGVEGGLPAPPFLPNIVRWTAPVAGDVTISYGFASPMPEIDVYVLQNGATLFGGNLGLAPDMNTSLTGLLSSTVAVGDTIDFVVAVNGSDARNKYTNLTAVIANAQPGQITGVVRSNLAGNPLVPGVTVTLQNGVTATTDDLGVYTFPTVMPGPYTLTFAKARYATLTHSGTLPSGGTETYNATLETSKVSGTITSNQAGNPPLAGVRVLLVENGYEAATDGSGHYEIQAEPGTYTAKFTLSGYDASTVPGQVLTSGGAATLNQQLAFDREIWDAGYDFQHSANPAGVWTYGYAFDGGYLTPYTATVTPYPTVPFVQWDEMPDGATGGLAAKSWSDTEQVIYGNGYVPPCPEELPHTLVLHPGMSGDKATVRWTAPRAMYVQIHAKFTGLNSAQTSTDGHIYLNGIPLYDCFVNGFVGTFESSYTDHLGASYVCDHWTVAEVAANDTVDFAVGYGDNTDWANDMTGLIATIEPSDVAPGTVSGTVLSGAPGNPPIEGAKVQSDDGRYWATTQYDGTYTMTVPSGSITLTASKTGFGNVTKTVYVPTNGSAACNFTLPTGQISGQVTATVGGVLTTLPGVLIRTDDGAYSTYTLEDGSYYIDMPPATYTVEAFLPGFDKLIDTVVVSGSTSKDWTLVQSTTIEADLAADFLVGANPSGTWSYGYYNAGVPGDFVLYGTDWHLVATPGQIEGWGDLDVSIGFLLKNYTIEPRYFYGNFEPGGIDAHPGYDNMMPTARWTAPQAARLLVTAEFADAQDPASPNGATTQGLVSHNGTTVASGLVDHYNGPSSWSYMGVVDVAQGDTIDFSLGMSSNGIASDMTKVSGHISAAPTPVLVPTISAVKSVAAGTYIRLEGKAAICAGNTFSDSFFIEEPDRSAGIQVLGTPNVETVLVGDRVTLTGFVFDAGSQKYIVADSLTRESGTELGALGVINRSAATANLLLARIWGTVTAVDTAEAPTYFYVNDGSNMDDGSGNVGVKVTLGGLASDDVLTAIRAKMATFVPGETFVSVTGIIGVEGTGSPIHPRTDADIN